MKIQDKEIPNLQKRYRVKKDGIETDCVCEFDREGFCTEGASLSNKKRNIYGYDIDGFDECGFDQDGVHRDTGTRFDKYGFNKKGIHMDTGTRFDKEGKMKSDYYNVKEKIEEPKLYKRPIEPNGINPRLSKKTFELRFFESYVNSIIKGECTEEEINEFCLELPRYKRPRRIIFADVPRNPTGKIEKPKLRKIYGAEGLVDSQNKS